MTDMTEPMSAPETARRFKHLEDRVTELIQEIREERRNNADTYMRKDIYETRHQELVDDINELKADRREDAKWRRQVALAIVIMAVPLVVTTAIAIFNLVRGTVN